MTTLLSINKFIIVGEKRQKTTTTKSNNNKNKIMCKKIQNLNEKFSSLIC